MEWREYLDDSLGMKASAAPWDLPPSAPLYLRKAASFEECECDGLRFVVASMKGGESLPDIKRLYVQTRRYADVPVAVASDALDARQRKALLSQGVPFVVPGRQVYLPFLALAATARAEARGTGNGDRLTSRAQAALVTLVAHPDVSSLSELREIANLSPSTATRAVEELAQRGLIDRSKRGREVVFSFDDDGRRLLKKALPLLASPVQERIFVAANPDTAELPDAGESALAARSMLNRPPIEKKALEGRKLSQLAFREVLEGELPDADTIEIEVWKYDPLVAGEGRIDDVSLALSLAEWGDERINGELDELFGEEGLWQ